MSECSPTADEADRPTLARRAGIHVAWIVTFLGVGLGLGKLLIDTAGVGETVATLTAVAAGSIVAGFVERGLKRRTSDRRVHR